MVTIFIFDGVNLIPLTIDLYRLKSFLEKNYILHDSQYGFREKRSIEFNIDHKLCTCGIFIDLQKAFDTVYHSILLEKLNHYGIRAIINDWFASYLVGRKQITQ